MAPQVLELDTLKPSMKGLSSELKNIVYSLVDFTYKTFPKKLNVLETKRVETPIDPDQVYFWSDEWQRDEHAIDEDFKKGRFKKFSTPKDAIAYLRG